MEAYDNKKKRIGMSLMVHDDMEQAVGDSIAAFAVPLLEQYQPTQLTADVSTKSTNDKHTTRSNRISGGIYFPEEVPNVEYRKYVLDTIKSTASELKFVI